MHKFNIQAKEFIPMTNKPTKEIMSDHEEERAPDDNTQIIESAQTGGVWKKKKRGKGINIDYLLGTEFPLEKAVHKVAKSVPKKGSMSKVTREEYVQGHFNFALNAYTFPTHKYQFNSDKMVEWKYVELITAHFHSKYCCPICMDTNLLVPKITKCGHVFCWICILQHIHHQIIKDPNEAISKCPLCYSPIKESDLKSCHLNVEEVPKSENLVILDKICKIRNSVILINQNLKEGTRSQEMQKFSEYSPKEYNFSRITLVYSISDLLQRENAALEQGKWLAESSQELEKVPFFEQAIIYNQNRELKYDSQSQITELNEKEKEGVDYVNTNTFYQIKSGQQYFLHPLCNKLINEEFITRMKKDLPLSIEGKILQIDWFQMDELNKKKYKFLNHIPTNSMFAFVEIDLGVLPSRSMLRHVQEQLEERAKQRHSQKRKELESIQPKIQDMKLSEVLRMQYEQGKIEAPIPMAKKYSGHSEEEDEEELKEYLAEEGKKNEENTCWDEIQNKLMTKKRAKVKGARIVRTQKETQETVNILGEDPIEKAEEDEYLAEKEWGIAPVQVIFATKKKKRRIKN